MADESKPRMPGVRACNGAYWQAYMQFGGHRYHLGNHKDYKSACRQSAKARILLFEEASGMSVKELLSDGPEVPEAFMKALAKKE